MNIIIGYLEYNIILSASNKVGIEKLIRYMLRK
jgi:hypothetical protein